MGSFLLSISSSPLLIILGGVIVCLLILNRPREWESFSKNERILISSAPVIVGVVAGVSVGIYNEWALGYSVFSLTTITGISLYTDFKWRHVRSDILWALVILSSPYWVLISEYELVPFICLLAVGFASLLLPFIGQSDSRAFILMVSVGFPSVGVLGMMLGLVVLFLVIFFYSFTKFLYELIIKKAGVKPIGSLPAVPFITSSLLIVDIASLFPIVGDILLS